MKVNAINILNHVFTAKRVSHNENRQNNICMPQTSYDCFQKNNIYNAITFTGVDGRGKVKQRGMMFHISNLPATLLVSSSASFIISKSILFAMPVAIAARQL